ncbi:MAG: hypothetical protein EBW87_03735, partial [Burkholderiaceae bacterium]|nr:hypothetical protein [Burkholderiaceae bacterium]
DEEVVVGHAVADGRGQQAGDLLIGEDDVGRVRDDAVFGRKFRVFLHGRLVDGAAGGGVEDE